MNLVELLDLEEATVGSGTPACGASHHGLADGQNCMRITGHAELGALSREAHAHHVRDRDTDGKIIGDYWFTWVNQEPVPAS